MTVSNPPFVLQDGSHGARLFRRAIAGIIGEGVATFNTQGDLKVKQNSPTAMSVIVQRGGGFILGDDINDQGMYFSYNDGDVVLTVSPAHATLARIDRVVLHVYDTFEGQTGDTATLEVIAGTPASSPSAPALPATALDLAHINVAAAATVITNANISDFRGFARTSAYPLAANARVYQTGTAQSIPDNTPTAVTFTNEQFDSGGMWTGAAPTRLTCPVGFSGRYDFKGIVTFAAAVQGSIRRAAIYKNGVEVARAQIAITSSGFNSGSTFSLPIGALIDMADGDYCELYAYHNFGGGTPLSLSNGSALVNFSGIRLS